MDKLYNKVVQKFISSTYTSLVGLLLSLTLWLFSPADIVPISYFFIGITILFISIWFNFLACEELQNAENLIPTIKIINFVNINNRGSFILEKNHFLKTNVLLTVYYSNSAFDEYFATIKIAFVQNNNELVQASIINYSSNTSDEISTGILSNNTNYIKKLKVYPFLTDEILTNISSH